MKAHSSNCNSNLQSVSSQCCDHWSQYCFMDIEHFQKIRIH